MKVMCMGATNAMACLHDVVSSVFQNFIIAGDMIVYADDWVLISETVEEHAELLERVLQRCREAKFVLHPGKSDFFVNEVTFLGFHVKDGQVQPEEDKAEAFKTWPTPKRARDVRAFLGAAN